MNTILQNALDHPENVAVVSNGRSFTYGELLYSAKQLAHVLLDGKADLEEERIAFLVDPSFEYVQIQWAIWIAGGIVVPLALSHPPEALQYVIEDADCSRVITNGDHHKKLPATKRVLLRLEDLELNHLVEIPEVQSSRRAMILYTSGTTNKPKGVVSTHANLNFQVSSLVKAWQWKSDDHILCVLPLHHVHGIIVAMSCALYVGATCRFLPKFDEEQVFNTFLQDDVNVFMAVPTIYYKLINHFEGLLPERQEKLSRAMRQFRLMTSGSAALPVKTLQQWEEISGQRLLERYGMTEMGIAISNPFEGERRPGHIGFPLPGMDIRIREGEIQVKGPNVFNEYWRKPAATEEAFTDDGWLRTGDIAEISDDGYYRILGRDSVDIIKSGGYKISALEIEEVLREHSSIKECGVVGKADEEWGEVVCAYIIANEQLDAASLKEWLRSKLPAYKIPRDYHFVNDLPRNAMGKLMKMELK